MKYIINIYNGDNLFKSDVDFKGYPWRVLDFYYDAIESFRKKGFRIVEKSTGASGGYTLLFNEKEKDTVLYSYETILITDFLDSTGQNILRGKKYKSSSGDVYQMNECDGQIYLRNLSQWNISFSYVKDIEGNHLNQNTIDDLKLKAE